MNCEKDIAHGLTCSYLCLIGIAHGFSYPFSFIVTSSRSYWVYITPVILPLWVPIRIFMIEKWLIRYKIIHALQRALFKTHQNQVINTILLWSLNRFHEQLYKLNILYYIITVNFIIVSYNFLQSLRHSYNRKKKHFSLWSLWE